MFQIGQYKIHSQVILAPMAGITDRPYRKLCKNFGAGYAVSEMLTSQTKLQNTNKTKQRTNYQGEEGIIAAQLAGTDPDQMAQAALLNIQKGAQIIDINMGCPAKKVCNKWAGSALMQNEELALEIIKAIIKTCAPQNVPVTLKMRTGYSHEQKNALQIALKAQDAGIKMLTIHGRTKEQGYKGEAEHDTVAQIKQALQIPVIANGDITSPEKAKQTLEKTKCDAVMIGRGAWGRPWIFEQTQYYLNTSEKHPAPTIQKTKQAIITQLQEMHELYGEQTAIKTARKHIISTLKTIEQDPQTSPKTKTEQKNLREKLPLIITAEQQIKEIAQFFDKLAQEQNKMPSTHETN